MSPGAFFVLAIAGAVAGFFCEVCHFLRGMFCNKIAPTIFVDVFCGLLIGTAFFVAEFVFLNFEIYVFGVLTFLLGIFLERTTVGFLLAKLGNVLYNFFVKAKTTKFAQKTNKWFLK